MMKRSFTPREKTLLIFLAILLLAFSYYFFVQKNVADSLAAIESQKSSLETEIQIAEVKAQKMQTMQKELAQMEANGYKSAVAEYDNLSQEIVFLNSTLARTTDYTISFADTETTADIVRRTINLSYTCNSYKESCNIIEKLQNCKYCCRLGSISMEPTRRYDGMYTDLYGYDYNGYNDILNSPLEVQVKLTFFEKIVQ